MKRIATVLVLAVGLGLTACADSPSAGGATPSAQPTSGVEAASHNSADVAFAQGMIPHHRQAVEMSELAQERAASPEVKALAARIQAAQEPEMRLMSEWLRSWGAEIPPSTGADGHAGHGAAGMMSPEELEELARAEGAQFDRMFLSMMVEHHLGAVEMAELELAEGRSGPAKDLAAVIAEDQRAEIEEMELLLDK